MTTPTTTEPTTNEQPTSSTTKTSSVTSVPSIAGNPRKSEQIGDNAAEACKKISSEAENIAARMKQKSGLESLTPWGAVASMVSDLGSKNENLNQLRNITNIDLSNNDIINSINKCDNAFTGAQINKIDLTKCQYCQLNGCTINGVTQTNVMENNQNCKVQSLIDLLMQKGDSVSNLATAKMLQDSSGIGTSNESKTDTCNYVNKNMSSNRYIQAIQECANKTSYTQTNVFDNCGSAFNIIQSNTYKNFQDCVLEATTVASDTIKSDTVAKTETDTSQKADSGLNLNKIANTIADVAKSALNASTLIIIGVVLAGAVVLVAGGYFVYKFSISDNALAISSEAMDTFKKGGNNVYQNYKLKDNIDLNNFKVLKFK